MVKRVKPWNEKITSASVVFWTLLLLGVMFDLSIESALGFNLFQCDKMFQKDRRQNCINYRYVRCSTSLRLKPKIGCLNLITKRWTRSNLFDERTFEAKDRIFEFDYKKINKFEFCDVVLDPSLQILPKSTFGYSG